MYFLLKVVALVCVLLAASLARPAPDEAGGGSAGSGRAIYNDAYYEDSHVIM